MNDIPKEAEPYIVFGAKQLEESSEKYVVHNGVYDRVMFFFITEIPKHILDLLEEKGYVIQKDMHITEKWMKKAREIVERDGIIIAEQSPFVDYDGSDWKDILEKEKEEFRKCYEEYHDIDLCSSWRKKYSSEWKAYKKWLEKFGDNF